MKRLKSQKVTAGRLGDILRRSDFGDGSPLIGLSREARSQYLENLANSYRAGTKLMGPFRIHRTRAQKLHFIVDDLDSEILLRKINADLLSLKKIHVQNRNQILNTLFEFMREGTRYRIYRLDIRRFFDNVPVDDIVSSLASDMFVAKRTVDTIRNVMSLVRSLPGATNGVPQGLSISSALSEISINKFDMQMRAHPEVKYFARFVDDIVIITEGSEDRGEFELYLESVAKPFRFNKDLYKYRVLDVPGYPAHKNQIRALKKVVGSFDYLGLNITIWDRTSSDNYSGSRLVVAELSAKKIRKIKSRIKRAVLDFRSNGNLSLLRDRIRVLTHKYSFKESRSGKKMIAGMGISYSHIERRGKSIQDLDQFLYREISGIKSTILPADMSVYSATARISFVNGLSSKKIFHFTPSRLNQILKAWFYE